MTSYFYKQQMLRFAIIYLHSWTHEDSEYFCRETLASQLFRDLLERNNMVFWACDVQSREGYKGWCHFLVWEILMTTFCISLHVFRLIMPRPGVLLVVGGVGGICLVTDYSPKYSQTNRNVFQWMQRRRFGHIEKKA